MDVRGLMEICRGQELVSPRGAEFHPQWIQVVCGNWVIFSCFGISQVLLMILRGDFLCPAHDLLWDPLGRPKPHLANSFRGPRQSPLGTSL